MYLEHSEGPFGTGPIIGERIPEEDVRIVETIENAHQQDMPVLPGAQRRKLYFNPAYFERQLLLVSSRHFGNNVISFFGNYFVIFFIRLGSTTSSH